ncbi:retrovirus-related pol polyprotein from transposon TNT 1-94 [Tanacetum coccineum]
MASSSLSFNFRAINHLARHGLVRGLPKFKFEKDHLCSACALGKSTKKPHKPKSEDTNQEKLYLLHMDLCRPMRVASVNGKKYILVIVDDYVIFPYFQVLRYDDLDGSVADINEDDFGIATANQYPSGAIESYVDHEYCQQLKIKGWNKEL